MNQVEQVENQWLVGLPGSAPDRATEPFARQVTAFFGNGLFQDDGCFPTKRTCDEEAVRNAEFFTACACWRLRLDNARR